MTTRDEMVEPVGIIGDSEGGLWRVLEVTEQEIFMLMLPERKDVVHTRHVSWSDFEKHGYELKFP